MLASTSSWMPISCDSVLGVLLDVAVKGLLLMCLAWGMTGMMRRSSSASRHLVWLCSIAGLLVLPVLSALLPGWHVLPGQMGVGPYFASDANDPGSPVAGAVMTEPLHARGERAAPVSSIAAVPIAPKPEALVASAEPGSTAIAPDASPTAATATGTTGAGRRWLAIHSGASPIGERRESGAPADPGHRSLLDSCADS